MENNILIYYNNHLWQRQKHNQYQLELKRTSQDQAFTLKQKLQILKLQRTIKRLIEVKVDNFYLHILDIYIGI